MSGQGGTAAKDDRSFERYEAGKGRRYGLLFAVNGGAFAIIALRLKAPAATGLGAIEPGAPLFGALTAAQVGWGMAAFTLVMMADIWAFGRDFGGGERFGLVGRAVLLAITGLICLAWLLATGVLG